MGQNVKKSYFQEIGQFGEKVGQNRKRSDFFQENGRFGGKIGQKCPKM